MAIRTITLREELRPWRNAGVSVLLLPEGLQDNALYAPPGEHPTPEGAPASSPLPEKRFSSPHARPEARNALPAAKPAPRPAAQQGASATARKSRTNTPAAGNSPGSGIPSAPLPALETWPVAWQQAFAKTRPAPLVWAYHELGLDLAGLGTPGRGDFFRSLLAALHLPAGSSTFWPTAVPLPEQQSALTPSPAVFQAGIQRLQPRAILFLGNQGIVDAGFQPQPLFQQYIDQGRSILHIPALEALMNNADQRQATISFLLAALDFLL